MRVRKYTPTDPKDCLAHVAEECGKLVAAIGKTMRFGPQSVNPELPACDQETNIAWVLREMDDVEISIRRFRESLLPPSEET